MSQSKPPRTWVKGGAVYGTAFVLCATSLTWVLQLWHANLRVPFGYIGDSLLFGAAVKCGQEHGWYLSNPDLGAPGGSQMFDLPMADNFHFLILKGLTAAGLDFAEATNLYFLLTFPLTAWSALFALRRLGVGAAPAITTSVLFAFLPYHFHRGIYHLFLAAYFLVPLMVLPILGLYLGPCPFFPPQGDEGKARFRPFAPRSLGVILLCLVFASAGIYYTFFACFLLLVAGLAGWLRRRQTHVLWSTGLLIGLLSAGFVANISPTLLYFHSHGKNAYTERTTYTSAENFGLKVTHMVLPLSHHRLLPLRRLRHTYDIAQPPSESEFATLGLAGTLGFSFLLFRGLVRRLDAPGRNEDGTPQLRVPSSFLPDGLSLLNLAALLLGTIGGLGTLFALLVNPSIRGYNRISVFIAFFSLTALALVLDWLCRKYSGSAWGRWLCRGLCTALAVVGVWDQTNAEFIPRYAANKLAYQSDRKFVRRIEAALPERSMVLQLPLIAYPEGHGWNVMYNYDHLRGYLHARRLRWSYGAVLGRPGWSWQEALAKKPLKELLPAAAAAGFAGVWVDRQGYEDGGANVEGELRRHLGRAPWRSQDGRLLFFDLRAYTRDLKRHWAPSLWEAYHLANTSPLLFTWRGGFYDLGAIKSRLCRWCSTRGELEITNGSSRPRKVVLKMCFSGGTRPARLRLAGSLLAGEFPLTANPRAELCRQVVVPPGRHLIPMTCDGPVFFLDDGSPLAFCVWDFTAQELGPDGKPLRFACCPEAFGGRP
jgi:phosphoglycerol transferase